MKHNAKQKAISVSNNTENIEHQRNISLQNYIDNHYKCDVFESGMNEEFVIVESKLNEL